jgi:hypothetical protein
VQDVIDPSYAEDPPQAGGWCPKRELRTGAGEFAVYFEQHVDGCGVDAGTLGEVHHHACRPQAKRRVKDAPGD